MSSEKTNLLFYSTYIDKMKVENITNTFMKILSTKIVLILILNLGKANVGLSI